MSIFLCPNCSKKNRSNAKFCQGCGMELHYVASRYILGVPVGQIHTTTTAKAVDTWRCGCGEIVDSLENEECSTNNLADQQLLVCTLLRHPEPPLPGELDNSIENWFYYEPEEAWYAVVRPQWQKDWFPDGLTLLVGKASHLGQERKVNQDAILCMMASRIFEDRSYTCGLFAVADGIGGHSAGEMASRTAINSLLTDFPSLLSSDLIAMESLYLQEKMKESVLEANHKVVSLHKSKNIDLGTTLTATMIIKGMAIITNVGDSRTWLFRNNQLKQITTDHSLVSRLVEEGQITPEEVHTHTERNVIYRSLGNKDNLEVDTFCQKLEPYDRLLLGSDGLWEMVRDDKIISVLQSFSNPQDACDELVRLANKAGGEDNISVVLVDVFPYTQLE